MNRVILIGNLANDPEAFTTQSGLSRSTFRLAVQRSYKNSEGKYDADFFSVVAWRAAADFCNKYLRKGRKVAVLGSIQVRSYDGQNGQKRWVTEIIADSVEAVGRGKDQDPGPEEPSGFVETEDEELPFN